MLPAVLKHLGKVFQKLILPIEEPLPASLTNLLARFELADIASRLDKCPGCSRPNALLLAKPAGKGKNAEEWRCKFCNQVVLGAS